MTPRSFALGALALGVTPLLGSGCSSATPGEPIPAPAPVSPSPPPALAAELSSWACQANMALPPGALLGLPPATEPLKHGITLHYRNQDVNALLPELSQKLGRGIAILGGGRTRINLDLEGASFRTAVRTLAFWLRADVYSLPGGTLIFERLGRGRLAGAVAGAQPLRSLLETLAQRAGASCIVDEMVDGVWTGAIPCEDPARAIVEICLRSRLHATRYGGVIAVSPRPLVGGDSDLDADKEWRQGLSLARVSATAGAAVLGTTEALIDEAAKVGKVRLALKPGVRNRGALSSSLDGAPWTDLVALVARIDHLSVRRDGDALAIEPQGSSGGVVATAAPAVPLLYLLAESAGEHIVSCPFVRGTFSTAARTAAPEDALRALAALEGLAVVELGGGRIQLLALGARRLETLGPSTPPTFLPDGRLVDLRLEAVVTSGRGPFANAALVGSHAVHEDDEVPIPGASPDECARVIAIDSSVRCVLRVSSSSLDRSAGASLDRSTGASLDRSAGASLDRSTADGRLVLSLLPPD